MSSCYLHVDLDAFFASVEQLDNPEYRGKAVIVGGLPSDKRAVVSTCSYEARKYGVHSAMPIFKAYKLCPNGIYLRGRMERYHEKSKEVMKIFYDFSPDVKQMSVDEAFIDITGTEMLFGSPEEVAKKLKATILEKTGLTVSVGVAHNKYIAKIASGVNKPNGLCIVPEGQEENFMLSLPLSKLWGAGTKTQEKLKSYGFYTMKDIHKAPLANLTSLFGNCTGSYLYYAVRGHEVEGFSDITKSRQISTEETFNYDLTDIFAIETALLKLCYTVRFRLLDENFHTKTLHVKIRYEDFSTVSIQSTYQRAVSSLDDMYEKVCALFKSKYEYGKGIRLLGVSAQNLQKGVNSEAQELFDFGEEKKQKIEAAVLNIQKKNPNSEIKKARQFIKKGLLSLLILLNLGFAEKTFGLEKTENPSSEKISEFFVEGDWELSLTQTGTIAFQNGASFMDLQPLVFKQNAGLSVYFMYDKKWYFDAVFQDGFSSNKILLGYKNQFDKGIFTEIKFGNKDVFLTSNYGSENFGKKLSQGKNTTFGTSFLIEKNIAENQKIKGEAFFRFDNLETFSKTWHGSYLYNSDNISLNSYIGRKYFYIPFNLGNIEIFAENQDKTFTKLKDDDFLFYQGNYQLEFKNPLESKTAILISDKGETENQLLEFIKNMESWFCQKGNLSLEEFLDYLGIENPEITDIQDLDENHIQHFFTDVNGKTGFWIYNPSLFSLFENKNIFPVKVSNLSDVELISKSANKSYNTNEITFSTNQEENLILTYNFLSSKEETTSEKILKSLFPLGNINPLIYLLPKSVDESDFAISVKSYSEENYNIGTNAEENSVVAYVNGFLTFCEYDKNSGNVIFQKKPNSNDRVQIFWKEIAEEKTPTLFTATGFSVDFTPDFSLSSFLSYSTPISLAAILDNNSDDFFTNTENQFQSNFQTGISLDFEKEYKNSSLKINNSTGIEYTNYNVLGKSFVYLPESRNSEKSYFAYDSIIQGDGKVAQIKNQHYEIIANLTENAETAELSFFLPEGSSKLYEAQGFILEAKISNQNILDFYDIYLEIGDSDNKNAKWTINSVKTAENLGISTEYENLFFPLSNLQKSKLGKADKAKIIFKKKDENPQNNIFGTLTVKSIQYENTGFILENGATIQTQKIDGKMADKVSISNLEATATSNLKKYVKPLPTANYKEIIFDFFAKTDVGNADKIKVSIQLLEFLEDGSYKTAYSKEFSLSEIAKNAWQEIKIDLEEKTQFTNPNLIQISVKNQGNQDTNVEFYIGKIYLSEAKSAFLLSDIFDFTYDLGNFLTLNTNITSNYNLSTKTKNVFGEINNSLDLAISIFEINNQIFADYSFGEENFVSFQNSSHTISTSKEIFDFISFSENYSYKSSGVAKENSLSFDFGKYYDFLPVKLDATSKISSTQNKNLENQVLFYKNASSEDFAATVNLEKYQGKIDFELMQNSNNDDNKLLTDNYFSSYFNSLYYQILQNDFLSQNDENKSIVDFEERKEIISFDQNFHWEKLNISPKFLIKAENKFSKTSMNPLIQSMEYDFSLPFRINKNNFSISYGEKVVSEEQNNFGNEKNPSLPASYSEDLENLFSNTDLFLLILPNYNDGKKIQEITDFANSKSQKAGFSWKRNVYSNIWDLVVPSSFSSEITKTYKSTNTNYMENISFLGKMGFSAFNIFGKNSNLELFDWYNFEEILTNFSANYNDQKWLINFNNAINLYLQDNASISNFVEVSFSPEKSFTAYESIFWNRNGKTAYLIPLVKIFNEDFQYKKITRNDGFSISLDKNFVEDKSNFCVNYSHKVSVFPTDYASINTIISSNVANYQHRENTKTEIDFEITLSGKIAF